MFAFTGSTKNALLAVLIPAAVLLACPATGSSQVLEVPRITLPSDTARVERLRLPGEVRICAGGDVTLGTNLGAGWAERAAAGELADPAALLAPLRPLVADADVVLLNVEAAIGEGPAPAKCGPRSTNCYAFRQPPAAAAALRGVAPHARVVGNVANNHSGDAGAGGFRATLDHLRRAGVEPTGADTLATVVGTAAGDTIAFLGFAASRGAHDSRDLAAVHRHVRRAAERHPLLVVSVHMGAEGAKAQRTRDRTEVFLGSIDRGNPVAFARTAIEAGADLVVGHGPHVVRAMEWRGNALVLYSLGNLVTYGPFSNRPPMDRGALVCALLDRDGRTTEGTVRSTLQREPGRVEIDATARAAILADSLGRLDFPRSGVRIGGDGSLVVPERDSLGDQAAPAGRRNERERRKAP
ncbi:hypothetical protein BH23GEM4_BH23GEM4_00470 [soil metagenome]